MTDLSSLLAPIREREAAATEGPWTVMNVNDPGEGVNFIDVYAETDGMETVCRMPNPAEYSMREWLEADAAFIAAARTAIPRLLAALDKVLAVHEPVDALMNPGRHERVVKVCTGCGTDDGNWQRYPCPTVRAVTAALGEQA